MEDPAAVPPAAARWRQRTEQCAPCGAGGAGRWQRGPTPLWDPSASPSLAPRVPCFLSWGKDPQKHRLWGNQPRSPQRFEPPIHSCLLGVIPPPRPMGLQVGCQPFPPLLWLLFKSKKRSLVAPCLFYPAHRVQVRPVGCSRNFCSGVFIVLHRFIEFRATGSKPAPLP